VEIANRRPRPARFRNPEIGVRLQDDAFIRIPEVADFGHPRVEGLRSPHHLRLPRPVRAVGVGGGLACELL